MMHPPEEIFYQIAGGRLGEEPAPENFTPEQLDAWLTKAAAAREDSNEMYDTAFAEYTKHKFTRADFTDDGVVDLAEFMAIWHGDIEAE